MVEKNSKLKNFIEQRKLYNSEDAKEANRIRLKNAIKKKMTTALVGAIAEFEKAFGEFWGHGIAVDDKNDDELDLQAVWKQCRNKIFDLGNLQIRGMEKELDGYVVELIKRTYEFHNKK